MKQTLKVEGGKWFVVGGLLLLMSIMSVGYVQADTFVDEKSSLTYMREEEKLARDVYSFLYDMWGSQIFANIMASEQKHMDAVKALLDKYGLEDPAKDKGKGEFTNDGFNELYKKLTDQGKTSLVEALKVGVFIEETDIEDLQAAINLAKHRDVRNVYNNLFQGSLNHLKAFVSNLAAQGVVYEP